MLQRGLTLVFLSLLTGSSWAAGVFIRSADTRLDNQIYRLDADINFQLSEDAREALENGVALTFELELELLQQSTYLWDEEVASLIQRFQLQYHSLSDRYILLNLNSGASYSFSLYDYALASLGTVRNFPLVDRRVIQPEATYVVRLRASLDIDELPTPLRLMAYFHPAWHLESEWYVWPLPQ